MPGKRKKPSNINFGGDSDKTSGQKDIVLKDTSLTKFLPNKSNKKSYLQILKYYTDPKFSGSFTLDKIRYV